MRFPVLISGPSPGPCPSPIVVVTGPACIIQGSMTHMGTKASADPHFSVEAQIGSATLPT
eukprot:32989-Eustigmatos_ZCMA.PRE.1